MGNGKEINYYYVSRFHIIFAVTNTLSMKMKFVENDSVQNCIGSDDYRAVTRNPHENKRMYGFLSLHWNFLP